MTVDEARLAAENLAADAAASATGAVAPPVESIGLALSGGGIRAALFSSEFSSDSSRAGSTAR